MIITLTAEEIIKQRVDQTISALPRPRFKGRGRAAAPFTSQAYSERAAGPLHERNGALNTHSYSANGQRSTLPR